MTTLTTSYARPESLAESDWLTAQLQDPSIRIVATEPREVYRRAHIAGS